MDANSDSRDRTREPEDPSMTKKREDETSPLSFLNTEFLKSPAARAIRILSEYLEPAERLRRARIRDTIVFFGSARSPSPEQAAEHLAEIHERIARSVAVSAGLVGARRPEGATVQISPSFTRGVELSRPMIRSLK